MRIYMRNEPRATSPPRPHARVQLRVRLRGLTTVEPLRIHANAAGSPAALQQYYGRAKIDPITRTMHVSLHDLDGKSLWEVKLDPEA